MKLLWLSVLCLGLAGASWAQEPLSSNAALKQLYRDYDPATKTATWVCTKAQQQPLHEGWSCSEGLTKVSVSVELISQLNEGDTDKTYVIASATPANEPNGYDCHACAPAIGVAVFAWRQSQWQLESANAALGFYGGFGEAPTVDLVTIGMQKHGAMLWHQDIAQGYAWSNRWLLAPLNKDVQQVWSIQDENDNLGNVDPTDKLADHIAYRAVATIRFLVNEEATGEPGPYFDIEVISRGKDREDSDHPMKNENWTEVYRFHAGKYGLLRHSTHLETQHTSRKSPQARSTGSK